MAESKTQDTEESNPYLKTYLKNHKDIKLPKDFAKQHDDRIDMKLNYRKDYKQLPKVKLFSIKNILSHKDCDTLIRLTNKIGYVPISFEYPQDYRKCERVICKSFQLASIIWTAITPYFNRSDIEDMRPYGFGNEGIWRPTKINEAIRFTRYRNGDYFKPHKDGGFTKSNLNRSVYSIMIYLNDIRQQAFQGGSTIFYSLKNEDITYANDKEKLHLTDEAKSNAIKVDIRPMKGMCVIFNHDIWHEGCTVITNKKNKYKYILRSDIMFECYNSETFSRQRLIQDPLYIKSQYFYHQTVELQNKGDVRESTISYLKALSIQAALPSIIVDKNKDYYGDEFYWFTDVMYEYIFSFLDVYRLVSVCYVSRAWYYYATSPNLWRNAYHKYFGGEMQYIDHKNDNIALFRPWKHIFSYRVMLKKEFPILVLNFWVNGIEVATTANELKDNYKLDIYYNHHQQLMTNDGTNSFYIPLVIAYYTEVDMWSWQPYRHETLIGKVVYKGESTTDWGFSSPQWIVDHYGVWNGASFYKLLREILYFPNIVLSLPSLMYDNELFKLYLKYMLTKFVEHDSNYSKVFCLHIKNMEEQVAKHYGNKNCIVIVHEHRSFSISVIKDYQRSAESAFNVKFIASKKKKNKSNLFPKHFYDVEQVQDLADFDFSDSNTDMYYTIGQQNDTLREKVKKYMNDIKAPNKKEYVNDIFVGPNIGEDIQQNQDYKNMGKVPERDWKYFEKQSAPYCDTFLCYEPLDLVYALNDVIKECNQHQIFEEAKENEDIAIILIGSMTKLYGVYIDAFCNVCNDDKDQYGMNVKYIGEYIENNGSLDILSRSSAVQYLLKTVVSPREISEFESITQIANDIIMKEKNTRKKKKEKQSVVIKTAEFEDEVAVKNSDCNIM